MTEPRPVAEAYPSLRRDLGLRDLVLFNISAVVGLRWLAAAAHIGPGSLSLWLLAAVFFFVPSAYAVSSLSARYPEQGGLYVWTKYSFGEWHGFLCGWLYWSSNLFYFPNLLVAGVGMAVYTLGSRYTWLAQNQHFVLGASLLILWISMLTNLVGMRVGKWTENLGGAATYAVGLTLILLGLAVWLKSGSATQFVLTPSWDWEKMNFWSQIAFAFGGLELGAIMGGEIRDPKRTVPRATWISGLAIAAFYIVGTTSLLVVIPSENVNVITGLAQAGSAAGDRLGLLWLPVLLALLITVGVTGQMGAWVSGTARIPFAIGLDRYLPPAFSKLHPRWRTPHVAILTQGVACTLFLIGMQLGESLRAGYQLLVDMTVITYFIPFMYLFLSAWKHGRKLSGFLGLFVTVASIGFSLAPLEDVSSVWLFEAKLIGGSALLILIGRMFFNRGRRRMAAAH